ncbi:hypothetical protein ACH5RR_040766 [Cinchona calisaya]|uniref:Uncharacterized protein n=1 Tax=Cinchona calisaya TaxID=153742 RepID=A0ABD2XXQ6_9GENT
MILQLCWICLNFDFHPTKSHGHPNFLENSCPNVYLSAYCRAKACDRLYRSSTKQTQINPKLLKRSSHASRSVPYEIISKLHLDELRPLAFLALSFPA